MLYGIGLLLFSTCTPNQGLSLCRDELLSLADSVQYYIHENKEWDDIFKIDGVPLHETLSIIASRLEEKFSECPCVGPCTNVESCNSIKHFD